MRLLIDAGNSRLKWNLCDDEGGPLVRQTSAIPWRESDLSAALDDQWQVLSNITSVWLSNVAGESIRHIVQQWLQNHWQIEPKQASSEPARMGVLNGYENYTQLGVDRWLALLASHDQFPGQNICVIDCGSAITVDVMMGDGKHVGGMILPGTQLMLESLLAGTNVSLSSTRTLTGLPVPAQHSEHQHSENWLGQNTADCISLGVHHGGTGFLEHIIGLMQDTFGKDSRIVATGGEAPQLINRVTSPVEYLPDLVLDGLSLVAGESK